MAMNLHCLILVSVQRALGFCLQGNVFITVNKNVEQGRGRDILIQPHVLLHQVFTFFFHIYLFMDN